MGIIILKTDYIDNLVTTLLWPILEGSSEGKTVLFFGILGSLLIISSLINQNKYLQEKLYKNENNHRNYILYAIIILIICGFIGLFIEAYIRLKLGVSFFTILTSMNPNTSTTSPMHSHAYKSILGYLSYKLVPSHINTGTSILKFVMPYVLIIVPAWICVYILGLIGLTKMRNLHKMISILALGTSLIGILDGGIFSQPFLIGIFLLLIVYFSNNKVHIKYLINPIVILGYILLVGMIIEVGGSNTSCHTLTVINQTGHVDMSEYNVTNISVNGDCITYTLNCTTPDKKLIKDVFESFKGKCDATYMSWNFYSYLDNPTMRMRQNKT